MKNKEIEKELNKYGIDPANLPNNLSPEDTLRTVSIADHLLNATRYFVIAFRPDQQHPGQEQAVYWHKHLTPADLHHFADEIERSTASQVDLMEQIQKALKKD